MSNTIFLELTQVGQREVINIIRNGLYMPLLKIQVGHGNGRFDENITALRAKDAEYDAIYHTNNTFEQNLRFSSLIYVDTPIDVSEVGLFNENGVLFAYASKESGFFLRTERDSYFSLNFAVTLGQELKGFSPPLVFNREDVLLDSLMQVHERHLNPHDQYKLRTIDMFKEHTSHADPHPQYETMQYLESISNQYNDYLNRLIDAVQASLNATIKSK